MQSASVACLALPYFYTLSHKRHDFREKVIEHKMCVLILSTIFVWNISYYKNWARYYHKCTQVFMWSTGYSCQILMKLEISWQIFEKCSNIKFHENLSNGSHVAPHRWMDRQTDMTKLTAAFHKYANMPKKCNTRHIRSTDTTKTVTRTTAFSGTSWFNSQTRTLHVNGLQVFHNFWSHFLENFVLSTCINSSGIKSVPWHLYHIDGNLNFTKG